MKPWLALLSCAVACLAAPRAFADAPPIVVAPGALPNGLPAVGAKLDLPDVEVPERRAVLEQGESPVYYRLADDAVSAWSRIGFGFHVGLPTEESDTFALATEAAHFKMDILGGVQLTFDRREPVSVVAELGYSYVYEDSHWFVAGFGPALHRIGPSADPEGARPSGESGIALIPHVVVGSLEERFAYGVRTSLLVRWTVLGVELAHQFARVDDLDRTVHEVHLGFNMAYAEADL